MMNSGWWVWMIVLLVLFASPIGYGWGYRGWGPPYPRYVQRRRSQRAADSGGSPPFNHHAWGWGGDFVWLVIVIGVIWVFAAPWWR